ncbi:diguanylate cyclase (GGDEF)-like protein [Bradyrhizobium sp. USDA 4452]
MVLANGAGAEQALGIGQRIIQAVTLPYRLADGTFAKVGVSVGVAVSPEHGTEAEELLAVADAALYEAKSDGKAQCRLASVATNVAALRRLTKKDSTPAFDRGAA